MLVLIDLNGPIDHGNRSEQGKEKAREDEDEEDERNR